MAILFWLLTTTWHSHRVSSLFIVALHSVKTTADFPLLDGIGLHRGYLRSVVEILTLI
jgi:hypothetical protein